MENNIEERILQATGANKINKIQKIQDLWSGYGTIKRISVEGGKYSSIILKHIQLPKGGKQITDFAHQRKLRSYKIEIAWYKKFNSINLHDDLSITPRFIDSDNQNGELIIMLEDLDSAGFPVRASYLRWREVEVCLTWLANFHARFLNCSPDKLWKSGTYWHLETRPEELEEIKGSKIYHAAKAIDQKLKESPFQTFVHGDAKITNFCFSKDKSRVAAVDFQYVGGGCGMKDVAYLIDGCLDEDECQEREQQILDFYFKKLQKALIKFGKEVDFNALESNWRSLYHYAWCDFYRFLKGWSSGRWGNHRYAEKLINKTL